MLTNPNFITLAEMSPLNSRLIHSSIFLLSTIHLDVYMHLKINTSEMIPVILTL